MDLQNNIQHAHVKLGFCFLVYDIINHEDIWYNFFKGVDTEKYAIYIHYKTQKPLKYFEAYKLKSCLETKYGHVSIIHAHNLLFSHAFIDNCYKIISLSQACVPLKSFDYIYDILTKDSLAHFNIAPREQCFPRCNTLLEFYDEKYIQKASNWFILNRVLCETILQDKENINREYGNIRSPEEHYYLTTLFARGLEDQVRFTPNLASATTFTNWKGVDYKYPSEKGLKNYSSITHEELEYLIRSPSLFGRKFNTECGPWLAGLLPPSLG